MLPVLARTVTPITLGKADFWEFKPRLSIPVINTTAKTTWGKKGFVSAYSFMLQDRD